MLTKKFLSFTLATALVSASPMLVYADNGGGDKDSHQDGGWQHGKEDHMLAKILNLTDDQEKQLKDIHKQQMDTMKDTFKQIKSNREAFESEIVKATPDMSKVNDLQTQLKTIQSQMADNHLTLLLAVKKVLTPEQFAGYMALKKEHMMKKRMMMRHGKFGHKDGFGKDGGDHDGGPQD